MNFAILSSPMNIGLKYCQQQFSPTCSLTTVNSPCVVSHVTGGDYSAQSCGLSPWRPRLWSSTNPILWKKTRIRCAAPYPGQRTEAGWRALGARRRVAPVEAVAEQSAACIDRGRRRAADCVGAVVLAGCPPGWCSCHP